MTNPPSIRAHLAWGLAWISLAAASAACRSSGGLPPGPPLPFHVALIPTEIHDTSVLTSALRAEPFVEPPGEEQDDDMRLDLSTSALSYTLARELEPTFVRTTLLELPTDRAGFAALDPAQRETYWQERAREVGANLLVRTRLTVDPDIRGERNEKFWLNLPLFLLGGPLCYFVGDRSYEAAARLQAEFFEISEEHDSLADFSLLPIPLYAEFQGTDLNFLCRADSVGVYALSLLVPAGLLSPRTEKVEEEIEERLGLELGRTLAHKVVEQRSQFEQNVALGAFRLESEHARWEPAGDGLVHLSVPVVELAPGVPLYRSQLLAGKRLCASQEFTTSEKSPGRQLIQAAFSLPPDERFLTLRIQDANSNARSYTLRVPVGEPSR